MRALSVLALLALAACSQPRANLTIEARPGSVSVSPSISGSFGGLSIGVRG